MKKLQLLSIAFLAALTVGTFTACGSEDDDNGGSSGGAKINGQSYRLGYGFWNTYNGELVLEFSNVDLANLRSEPSSVNILTLNVETGGNATSVVTGTFDAYMEFYSMNIRSGESVYQAGAAGQVKVTIEGSGGNYKVTIPQTTVGYYAGADESRGSDVPFSFSYSGSLTHYDYDE